MKRAREKVKLNITEETEDTGSKAWIIMLPLLLPSDQLQIICLEVFTGEYAVIKKQWPKKRWKEVAQCHKGDLIEGAICVTRGGKPLWY